MQRSRNVCCDLPVQIGFNFKTGAGTDVGYPEFQNQPWPSLSCQFPYHSTVTMTSKVITETIHIQVHTILLHPYCFLDKYYLPFPWPQEATPSAYIPTYPSPSIKYLNTNMFTIHNRMYESNYCKWTFWI
jgi:hypothetical protein